MKAARTLRALSLIALFALSAPIALAQTPAPAAPTAPLAYDAVSIKPNHSGSPGEVNFTPSDGYRVENYRVHALISEAFGIRADLISGGPGWIDTDHYDLTAKVSGDDVAAYKALSKAQRGQLLQAVLADRFHLVAHTVVKETAGYTLTIAKGGFKLQPVPLGTRGGWGAGSGDIKTDGMSISSLADLLSSQLRQTVVDQTGLTGKYAFHLQWAQDLSSNASAASNPGAASEPSGLPALPTALEEQLGLKLTPAKLPTTTLVIDSIQPPAPN